MQSFINIHIKCNRALSEQAILYRHAIFVHKMYNLKIPEVEWIALNFQLAYFRKQNFLIIKTNTSKVGNNIIASRLHILNKKNQT